MTFSEYILELYNSVPHYLYQIELVAVTVGIVIIMAIGGRKKWLLLARLTLIGYVILIYSSTIFYRDSLLERELHVLPFESYLSILNNPNSRALFENIMNVVLFVPVGILLGLMVHGSWLMVKKEWLIPLAVGLCISVSIEVMQFVLKRGFAEVDDVMHNTVGCLIGYGLWLLVLRLAKWQSRVS